MLGQSTVEEGGNSEPFVNRQNGALRGVTAGGPTSDTHTHTHTHFLSLTHAHIHTCFPAHAWTLTQKP